MARSESSIVYIVDDDASLRRSLRNLLSSVGYRVETFESAAAFLEADPRLSTGCLLLDLRMPGIDGLALLKHLKATRSPHPVIILTGHGNGDARQQSLSAGAIDFIEKPFASDDLFAAVERGLSLLAPRVGTAAGATAMTLEPLPRKGNAIIDDRPISFAGGTVGSQRHICAFFNGTDEAHRVLRSFVKDGIDAGDRTIHIVDPEERLQHVQWLRDEGIDVEETTSSGQLDVRSWDETYLLGNRFDQDAMLAQVEDALGRDAVASSPPMRVLAHMEWALLDKHGVEDLVEYETRVNAVLPKYGAPVICVYDLSKFNASVVMDILRTHPMVIIGGLLQQNPFYVPPGEFLLELRARRSDSNSAAIAS